MFRHLDLGPSGHLTIEHRKVRILNAQYVHPQNDGRNCSRVTNLMNFRSDLYLSIFISLQLKACLLKNYDIQL